MEKGTSFSFIAVLLALLVLGGGIVSFMPPNQPAEEEAGSESGSDSTPVASEERNIHLSITNSLKLVLNTGEEYRTGDVIKAKTNHKIEGKLKSINDSSFEKGISYNVKNEQEQVLEDYIPCSDIIMCERIYGSENSLETLLSYVVDDETTGEYLDGLNEEEGEGSFENFF